MWIYQLCEELPHKQALLLQTVLSIHATLTSELHQVSKIFFSAKKLQNILFNTGNTKISGSSIVQSSTMHKCKITPMSPFKSKYKGLKIYFWCLGKSRTEKTKKQPTAHQNKFSFAATSFKVLKSRSTYKQYFPEMFPLLYTALSSWYLPQMLQGNIRVLLCCYRLRASISPFSTSTVLPKPTKPVKQQQLCLQLLTQCSWNLEKVNTCKGQETKRGLHCVTSLL